MSNGQVTGMNYFNHQFLRQDDFQTAQDYHIARLRQHNELLHRSGILSGLTVARVTGSTNTVTLSIGQAVDRQFREVNLRQTTGTDVAPLLRIQTTTGIFQEREVPIMPPNTLLTIDLSPVLPASAPVFLTLYQGTKAIRPSSDPGANNQNTRIVEQPIIEVTTTAPNPATDPYLILARINRNNDGTISGNPVLTDRQNAGAVLSPGSVDSNAIVTNAVTDVKIADNAVTATKIVANAVTDVKIANNAVTTAKLDTATQARLVNNGSSLNITADLNTAAGRMGIGTATPAQKLDVNGTINATGYQLNGTALTFGSQVRVVTVQAGVNLAANGVSALFPVETYDRTGLPDNVERIYSPIILPANTSLINNIQYTFLYQSLPSNRMAVSVKFFNQAAEATTFAFRILALTS